MTPVRCWVGLLAVICSGLAWADPPTPIDKPPAESPPAPLLYRQHLMSEELIAEQGAGFLPMKRSRFEEAVRERSHVPFPAMAARLERSAYRFRMVKEGMLGGDAQLVVAFQSNLPAEIALAPLGIAIGKLSWQDVSLANVEAGVDGNGRLVVLVDRPGTLVFPWTFRGTRTRSGEFEFPFRLPSCPRIELQLELDSTWIPTASQAVVHPPEKVPGSTLQLWRIDAAAPGEFTLRLRRQDAWGSTSQVYLREALAYRLTNSGLELDAHFRLEIPRSPVRELTMEVDANLEVAAVQLRDKGVAKKLISTSADRQVFRLAFSEPVSGPNLELFVTAMAPIQHGRKWPLPTIRLPEAEWQAGTATVEIVEPLTLAVLQLRGCVAKKVEPLPLPNRGEIRQFQCFSPDRGWELQLVTGVQELTADTGFSLRCTESVVTGQFVADISTVRGDPFELRGRMQRGWIIDNVLTEPADTLETFVTEGAGQQVLRVRLRQAVRVDRPTRLIVRGHRRGLVTNRPTSLDSLRFMRLETVTLRNGLVAVLVEPPLRLSVTNDQGATYVDSRALSSSEFSRLTLAPGAAVYRDGPAVDQMSLAVAPEQPVYSANIEMEARVEGQSLVQTYQFALTPERSPVARVGVRFSEPGMSDPVWELVGVPDNSLTVRRLEALSVGTGNEFWELATLRPMSSAYTVRAVRKSRFAAEATLSLASVPEASSQSGLVRVAAADGSAVEVTTRNMSAVATPRLPDAEAQAARGLFRYLPSQDAMIRLVRPPETDILPSAWIWLCQLSSRVSGGGDVEHRALLLLENGGVPSLTVRLPTDVAFLRAAVDGVEVEPDRRGANGRLTISLPKSRRFPAVELTYVKRQTPFRFADLISAAWPNAPLKCLQRRWIVRTPPGVVVARTGALDESRSFDERLFGVRLLRRSSTVLDPWSVGPWRRLLRSSAPLDNGGIEPAGAENEGSDLPAEPWLLPAEWAADRAVMPGWNHVQMDVGAEGDTSLLVYSQDILQASSWACLLVTCALLCWVAPSQPAKLVWVPLAAAVALMLAPTVLLPILRGVFFGGLLANLWVRLARPYKLARDTAYESPAPGSVGERAAFVSWLLILCFGAACLATVAQAQSTDATPLAKRSKRPAVYPVLIPVDDQRQPLGDYVYVPRALFDELHRGAGNSRPVLAGPLLASAHYVVELMANDELLDRPQLRRVVAEYQLGHLREKSQLNLALRRDRVRVSDVRLDGQLVPYRWENEGQLLIVIVDDPASQRLQLTLRPVASMGEELLFPIPVVPRSRVTVRCDVDSGRIEIPTALGLVDRTGSGEVSAELGPASELHVRWSVAVPPMAPETSGEVSELFWLFVQPNSVIVQAQFKYTATQGAVELIEIEADPRLRLLPLAPSQPWQIEEVLTNDQRLLRCWFDGTPDQQARLELSFAMSGGLGNFALPWLRARAGRRAPTWWAVTSSSELESRILPEDSSGFVSPSEFAQAWSGNVEPPQAALALDDGVPWKLSVAPRELQFSAEQDVEINLGYGYANLAYEAQCLIENGAIMQQLFFVPEGFEPREIIVIHDDVNRLLRWVRVDRNRLAVFFTVPLSGGVRIWVKGDVPLGKRGSVYLPIVTVADNEAQKLQVRIFQRNDLQVELVDTPGLVSDASSSAPSYRQRQGRFLASFVGGGLPAGEVPAVRLRLTPNQPEVRGSLITAVSNENQEWRLTAAIQLNPKAGYVDAVRLRLPDELEDSLEVTPPVDIETVRIPGERGRQLVLRLPQPMREEIALRIRGQWKVTAEEVVRVPDIQLLDVPDVRRFVILPRVIGQRPVTWETSGLQTASLPEARQAFEGDPSGFDSYQVVGSTMQAVLAATDRVQGVPEVYLADCHCRWFADRAYYGWVAWDLDPAGARELDLVLPDKSQLVRVAVGGLTVVPRPAGRQSWKVPMAIRFLPQRMEVLFRGTLTPARDPAGIHFLAPSLADAQVRKTLWTIHAPGRAGEGRPQLTHTLTTAQHQREARLAAARQLGEAAASGAAREIPGDLSAWNSGWHDWLRQLDEEVASFALESNAQLETPPRYDVKSLWSDPGVAGASVTRAEVLGAAPSLVVRYPAFSRSESAWRVASALSLLAGLAMIRRLVRVAWLRTTCVRYPHLGLGLIGVLVWLSLEHGIFGLGLLVLAVLLALRPPWKTKPV